MKLLIVLTLLVMHMPSWAQKTDYDELGRALANYQACSEVSISIKDELMFQYYQKMFNDISISLLSLNEKGVKQVYLAWNESEEVLGSLNLETLEIMCLSRFDELSRTMLKNSNSSK